MKRIDAIIPSERLSRVNGVLKKVGISGLTCFDTKGRGKTPIKPVQTSRGTATYTPEFATNCSILVVVKDGDVDKTVQAILNSAGTGLAGEGKVFVSTVDEVVDIGSKRRGELAL